MRISIIFTVLVFLSFSCESFLSNDALPSEGLLTKVEDENGEVIANFKYDRFNRLLKSYAQPYYLQDYFAKDFEELSYDYNADDQLVKVSGFQPGNPIMSSMAAFDRDIQISFEYAEDGQLLSRREGIDFGDGMEESNYEMLYTYEFVNDTCLRELQSYYRADTLASSYYREFIFDDQDNIVEISQYDVVEDSKQANVKETFVYDDMKLPRSVFVYPESKNNVISHSYTSYSYLDSGDVEENTYEVVFEYEYNDNGYPVKCTETWENTIEKVKNYFYK